METVACHECDLLQRVPELPPGGKARCSRCGNTVAARPRRSLDRALALTVTAAIVFIIAHTTRSWASRPSGARRARPSSAACSEMWQDGERVTAVIVLFCAGIAPGVYLAFMLTVLLAVTAAARAAWVGEMMRWSHPCSRGR